MFSGAVGGLLVLLLGLIAAPVASASQKPAVVRRVAAHAAPAAVVAGDLSARPPTRYKYNLSSIAWAGSRAVIAATDAHGDLYYFWLAAGHWHSQEVAKGKRGVAYSKPAIAWTGHSVVIAAINASGALVYFAQHSGSSKWSSHVISLVPHHRYQAPSVTGTPGGGVLISSANSAGDLLSFELGSGGGAWTENIVGYGTFGASSVITCYDSLADGYLALITATSGGTLYFWWQFVNGTSWNQEVIESPGPPGAFTSGGSIAATANDLLVTAATATGQVYFWSQAIGGTGWSRQVIATGGTVAYSHPAVAWTGPFGLASRSYDVIAATSQHGELDYWWAADGGTSWTHERIAASGRNYVYANPRMTVSTTSVIITAVNSKPGDVWYWHQPFGTNPWPKQRVAQG
jgi:hypothetical protein